MEPRQELKEYFLQLVGNPSDINEHLLTLCDYAKRSESVCEMGVRQGLSSAAFAQGLLKNQTKSTKLISIDIEDCSSVHALKLAKSCGIDAEFVQGNSVLVDIPEVDLLFIDTWHCYGHLRRELEKHHHKARRWIVLHDTTVYGRISDSAAMQEDLISLSEKSGYSIDEIYRGLSFAIRDFLELHPEWSLEIVHEHNNGLTILKRTQLIH